MKIKLKLACAVVLLFIGAACEPFILSLFPGYISDYTISRDLNVYVPAAAVEHYDFSVLNNGAADYVFLVAYFYNGERHLYVFNNDLVFQIERTSAGFGTRACTDAGVNFVIGNQVLAPGTWSLSNIYNEPPGNGFGGIFLFSSLTYSAIFDAGGTTLNGNYYTSWSIDGTPFTVPIVSGGTGNYNLIHARRLINIPAVPSPLTATVLVFRDSQEDSSFAHAVILPELTYGDITACNPLLIGSYSANYRSFPLGEVEGDGTFAWSCAAGVIARNKNGSLVLFNWNGQPIAFTRDTGASDRVLMDYGFTEFYYVFDPGNLRLYKARNWWNKN